MGGRPRTLTAVRRARPGRVALEVDGRRWRVVPDDVVLRCGLMPGLALERPLLRELRRELRRSEALAAATRTVARRDVSTRSLRKRLAARGIGDVVAEGAVATLAEAGVLDDARTARNRAGSLAERGWGDLAVAARLAGEGFDAENVQAALSTLQPERVRARALAVGRDRRAAWTLLARRGFGLETIEDTVGTLDDDR